jgi:hypothetical protein
MKLVVNGPEFEAEVIDEKHETVHVDTSIVSEEEPHETDEEPVEEAP